MGDSIEFATEELNSLNGPLRITIRDSNQRAVFHSTVPADEATSTQFGPFVAPVRGIYTVTINGVGDATSEYQFRVSGNRPPHIWANSLRGSQSGLVNEAWLFFDQPMDLDSFSLEQDLLLLRTPTGNLEATGYRWENNETLVVNFPNQWIDSQVQLTLAPTITNINGLELDQNRNGIPGQRIEDRYTILMTHDSDGPFVVSTNPSSTATLR
jgi:hypothetical protein